MSNIDKGLQNIQWIFFSTTKICFSPHKPVDSVAKVFWYLVQLAEFLVPLCRKCSAYFSLSQSKPRRRCSHCIHQHPVSADATHHYTPLTVSTTTEGGTNCLDFFTETVVRIFWIKIALESYPLWVWVDVGCELSWCTVISCVVRGGTVQYCAVQPSPARACVLRSTAGVLMWPWFCAPALATTAPVMTLYAQTKAENSLITNDPVSTCPGCAMVPKLGWEEVSERCGRLPAE